MRLAVTAVAEHPRPCSVRLHALRDPGRGGKPSSGSSSSATGAGPCRRSTSAAPSAPSMPTTKPISGASADRPVPPLSLPPTSRRASGKCSFRPCWPGRPEMSNARNAQIVVALAQRTKARAGWLHGSTEAPLFEALYFFGGLLPLPFPDGLSVRLGKLGLPPALLPALRPPPRPPPLFPAPPPRPPPFPLAILLPFADA